MSEVLPIRHPHASVGGADDDRPSARGRRQAEALGWALRGVEVGAALVGRERRHRETWEGMAEGRGLASEARIHPGPDELDFAGLIAAAGRGGADRRNHVRAPREAVPGWQRGEVERPPETWDAFSARMAEAPVAGAPFLAVPSGGAVAQMVATTVRAPPDRMIELRLRMRNCAVSRLVVGRRDVHLHSFNEASRAPADADLVSHA